MALDDYGALIQSGMNLIPDVNSQMLQRAQTAALGAETQQRQAETQALQQKQSRAQMFQQDLKASDGSPRAVSALIMKYPELADELTKGFNVQDKATRDADLTTSAEIYSAANSGNWDLAKKLTHIRADAEKAAGHSDPTYDAAIESMDRAAAGDKEEQKGVLNLLGTHLAAVTGAEHFGTVYGALKGGYTLEAGATRFDQNGNIEAQSPFIKGQDGAIYERDAAPGTGAPAPAASPSTAPGGDAGFDHAVAFTLRHEGGYNPHDMNGAPVNFGINQAANPGVDVAHMTQDEAKDIYKTKYWEQSGAAKLPAAMQTPYFDTYVINPSRAEQFLKASGGDPNKFMDLRETWLNSVAAKNPQYAKAYATRNADLRLTMAGTPDAQTVSPAGAPTGFHTLIAGKPKDAPSGWQWSADGKSLEPIPNGPADPAGPKNQGPLNPKALETATVSYIKTGKMPAGFGGQAMKNQIINNVPTIMDQHGLTPDDMPSIQQQFQADSKAFSQRVGQLSYMRQSVGKLNQHAQDLSALIKAVPAQSSFKPFNWITQSVEGSFSNSTITQLQAGLPLFEAEVARVMTGNPNSGSGQLSDNARHEFAVLSSPAAPSAKIDAINRIMKMTDEAVKATRDETVGLKQRLGGGVEVYAGKALANPTSSPQPQVNIPQGAIQLLKQNPSPQMRQFFDQKFGPGKAAQIIGH